MWTRASTWFGDRAELDPELLEPLVRPLAGEVGPVEEVHVAHVAEPRQQLDERPFGFLLHHPDLQHRGAARESHDRLLIGRHLRREDGEAEHRDSERARDLRTGVAAADEARIALRSARSNCPNRASRIAR